MNELIFIASSQGPEKQIALFMPISFTTTYICTYVLILSSTRRCLTTFLLLSGVQDFGITISMRFHQEQRSITPNVMCGNPGCSMAQGVCVASAEGGGCCLHRKCIDDIPAYKSTLIISIQLFGISLIHFLCNANIRTHSVIVMHPLVLPTYMKHLSNPLIVLQSNH